MYKAKLSGVDLNYRDSRPKNGNLGNKLGTWRLSENPELWVLDVKNGWAAVYWNDIIVYASNRHLQPNSSPINCYEQLQKYGERIENIDKILDELDSQFIELLKLWESDYIIPETKPNFNFRLGNEWGWLMPVQSNFLWSDEEDHTGRGSVLAWDIAHKLGANVWSPVNGEIISVYRTTGPKDLGPGKYGSHVYIRTTAPNGKTYDILLAHLTRHRIYVDKGDVVTPNTLISHISLEGLTSDTHVHMEIRDAPFSTRRRIEEFWDFDKMFYCRLCKVSDYID